MTVTAVGNKMHNQKYLQSNLNKQMLWQATSYKGGKATNYSYWQQMYVARIHNDNNRGTKSRGVVQTATPKVSFHKLHRPEFSMFSLLPLRPIKLAADVQ